MKYLNQFHKEAMERTMKKIAESSKTPMDPIEAAKYMWRNFEMAKKMEEQQSTEYYTSRKTKPEIHGRL